ncbi:interferon-inducible GTPase 5-like isoform X1 [Dendronephthya gigantea]|uniref:interferon-inducible GTPase 5-like isoform X1 n=2 Tax=Dendronephthya gigantea TaxID=151771 RepID=UPI00106A65A4|nr:interferon-inducible GTPase 5-like isoform X1 [Dendronephthya gigantea]
MGNLPSKRATSEGKYISNVNFALVGSSGCGKSAFVNAVRGINDANENAARVDVVETGGEPIEYMCQNPLVSLWDLPGYGTDKYPNLELYWKRFKLDKFERFLIFISPRVTKFDIALIEKVKSAKKSFFLICTKMDIEYMSEKRKSEIREEELMTSIRDFVLKRTSLSRENIFLISNYDPDKWEFPQLIRAITTDTTADLVDQYMDDTRTYVNENGVTDVENFLKKKLEGSKEVKIRFGITGEAGVGKSAFMNAIRGLTDDDERAAKVDVVEATVAPTEYQHPSNQNIIFVDLPGIGTPKYPDLATYCRKVGFADYDTFLIFTAFRFRNADLELAKKVKEMGKSFFLIRTKIDVDLTPKKGGKPINEEETLEKIKKNCFENVTDLICSEKEVFLISNYDTNKWDFDRLILAISDALPILQRECLTISLTNITRECLKRKARFLKAKAVAVAAVSGGAGAIPFPGIGCAIDVVIIKATLNMNFRAFGLENTAPEAFELLEKKFKDVITRYQMSSAVDLIKSFGAKAAVGLLGAEQVSKFIPFIGLAIAGSLSFAATFYFLNQSIDEMEEVALVIWDNAFERSVKG